MGNANLKITCSRLKNAEVEDLARRLRLYFPSVIVAGNNLIFAEGKVHGWEYDRAWQILRGYDVTVE